MRESKRLVEKASQGDCSDIPITEVVHEVEPIRLDSVVVDLSSRMANRSGSAMFEEARQNRNGLALQI